MPKQLFVIPSKEEACRQVADYIIDWCLSNPGMGLGGATGRSPVDVWAWVWKMLQDERAGDRWAVVEQKIMFLDEYVGAYPSYYHWAWRNLRVGQEGGFPADNVHVPRGCFFDQDRIVSSEWLDAILADHAPNPKAADEAERLGQWQALTLPGEKKLPPPEVRIHATADHPVLARIRDAMADYDKFVCSYDGRLQLLGIGVGGAIDEDDEAGGHIGFVEYGAAARDTKTMLVRLAPSTSEANESDFLLENEDGNASVEPSHYAITQGISTVLSAGELLLMAWGKSKRLAVERMLQGRPGPKNPAAWLQEHANATVFMDQEACGQLDLDLLRDRGWNVRESYVEA